MMPATAETAGWTGPTYKGKPGWEFTTLDGLDLDALPPAPAGELPAGREPMFGFDDALTSALPGERADGVLVAPLRDAIEGCEAAAAAFGTVVRDGFFSELNSELWTDGTLVLVPKGVRVSEPIVLSTVQAEPGTALHHRTLVLLEEGAEAEVYDQVLSAHDEDALVNGVIELIVGANATLRYHAGQDVSERCWLFGSERGTVAADGTLEWTTLGFGGRGGKVFLESTLAGRGSDAKVTGAYATRGRQHVDFDTLQEHAAPDTTSDLAFRGLISGRSTAVWRGMIKVDPGAQRTDAFQEARNLLLGKRAHADAIPGLEILADDVRCTHAAAIAQIDPAQVFYLRTRGLGEDDASRLIVEGFLAAITERYQAGRERDAIAAALDRRLAVVLGGS